MGFLKPTRDDKKADRSQIICDLDMIDTQSVSFVFQGKPHVLKPITTRVFFEFLNSLQGFAKGGFDSIEEENKSFLTALHVVCEDITKEDVDAMTVIQKSVLLNGIRAKIMGSQESFEVKKKTSDLKN